MCNYLYYRVTVRNSQSYWHLEHVGGGGVGELACTGGGGGGGGGQREGGQAVGGWGGRKGVFVVELFIYFQFIFFGVMKKKE